MPDHSHHGHPTHVTAPASAHAASADAARPVGGAINGLAFSATVHCLSGRATGEVPGMVIGAALGWGNGAIIVPATVLAFVLGYLFTMVPLARSGLALGAALGLALAADTVSVAIMEVIDAAMLVIPGAVHAPLASWLSWGSLAPDLALAAVVAFPVNRRLIARGRGHAVVHTHHAGHRPSSRTEAPRSRPLDLDLPTLGSPPRRLHRGQGRRVPCSSTSRP